MAKYSLFIRDENNNPREIEKVDELPDGWYDLEIYFKSKKPMSENPESEDRIVILNVRKENIIPGVVERLKQERNVEKVVLSKVNIP